MLFSGKNPKDLVIQTGAQSLWDAQIILSLSNGHEVIVAKTFDQKGYKYAFPLKKKKR